MERDRSSYLCTAAHWWISGLDAHPGEDLADTVSARPGIFVRWCAFQFL